MPVPAGPQHCQQEKRAGSKSCWRVLNVPRSNALRLFGSQKAPLPGQLRSQGHRLSPLSSFVQPGKTNSWPRELAAFFFPHVVALEILLLPPLEQTSAVGSASAVAVTSVLPFCKTVGSKVETRARWHREAQRVACVSSLSHRPSLWPVEGFQLALESTREAASALPSVPGFSQGRGPRLLRLNPVTRPGTVGCPPATCVQGSGVELQTRCRLRGWILWPNLCLDFLDLNFFSFFYQTIVLLCPMPHRGRDSTSRATRARSKWLCAREGEWPRSRVQGSSLPRPPWTPGHCLDPAAHFLCLVFWQSSSGSRLVFVPSLRDVHHEPVYPQPPFSYPDLSQEDRKVPAPPWDSKAGELAGVEKPVWGPHTARLRHSPTSKAGCEFAALGLVPCSVSPVGKTPPAAPCPRLCRPL